MRSVEFAPKAFADLIGWMTSDRKTAARVMRLIQEAADDPFIGIGKPEPLKRDKHGLWSRRIDHEHRLVYQVTDQRLIVHSCREHYS